MLLQLVTTVISLIDKRESSAIDLVIIAKEVAVLCGSFLSRFFPVWRHFWQKKSQAPKSLGHFHLFTGQKYQKNSQISVQ